jgi:UTP--glucose-1-phosphate uridylyltransferase
MQISTAIIPVAGFGTRRLPITKAVEKCMLPIGNRPVIDYVVEDCLRAGVRDIWFVVGENSRQLREYYGHNPKLENALKSKNKTAEFELIQPPTGARFHYVKQPASGKYGTTIPVALALDLIGTDQPLAILMGDDFIYRPDDGSTISDLAKDLKDGEAAMLGVKVDPSEVENYGVIQTNASGHFQKIIEKPKPADAPSNLINVSKYIAPPELLKLIVKHSQSKIPAGQEYQITDPINEFVAAGGVMKVVPNRGDYLDGGNLAGWICANDVVGAALLKNKFA